MTTHEYIELIVCNGEGISKRMLDNTCSNRSRELVFTRQLIFYFMRNHSNESLREIGRYYSKSHSDVISSMKAIENLKTSDKNIYNKVQKYQDIIIKALKDKRVEQDAILIKMKYRLIENITLGKQLTPELIERYHEALNKESLIAGSQSRDST
jgi:hypothetical protein